MPNKANICPVSNIKLDDISPKIVLEIYIITLK